MTDGGSPWYVSTAFTPRRFDVADLHVLFGAWAESESASASRVEDAVLEGVIALTQGHRGWSMKLAGELVGVKPLPSFTAAWWWGETKRTVRLERVLTAAEIVVGFTDRLTHLGAASALLTGTALSVVRQRQAAGDPVERGDPVIRDWATPRRCWGC